jgi:glucose/arabinose dehydrogenase
MSQRGLPVLYRPVFEFLEERTLPASLPPGFTETLLAENLSRPTAMAFAPDGRLFVIQQGGAIRVIKDGSLLAQPFETISVNSSGERGLLGVAFDPDFATNRYVYVYYTTSTSPIHNRVSRFIADGDRAVPGSERVILELNNLSSATNHNGGAIHFGPDGKLYIAVGENATPSNSQTLNNLLGKMLRINKDGSIPNDNPFFDEATGRNRAIWALGLRNPFTFAFQPDTGRMFINDVGQNTWEEINEGLAGANYGWPDTEGPTNDPDFVSPLASYDHDEGCAITGGAFYNPTVSNFPNEHVGDYFFADYCSGWIRKLDLPNTTPTDFASDIVAPVDLQVGPEGGLYYLARGFGGNTGQVYRIDYTASPAPRITQHPSSQIIPEGGPVTFRVRATGEPPLSYQWQRDGVDIPGATSSDYAIAAVTLADDGAEFRAIVTNAHGMATSNIAALTVTPNQAPTGTITSPTPGTRYRGGARIDFSGTGMDLEDGGLPPSAFTWRVDFHHEDHVHPFVEPLSGVTGSFFDIPTL